MRARKRIAVNFEAMIEAERPNPSQDSLLGRLCTAQDEEDGTRLSTDAIIDNVLTLIFAGSDTTASAVTSLWITLSQRPDIKDKIRSNPDVLAPKLVGKILQMYPPAPFQMRLVKEDIPIGDYIPSLPDG
jgi:cytochrome P450